LNPIFTKTGREIPHFARRKQEILKNLGKKRKPTFAQSFRRLLNKIWVSGSLSSSIVRNEKQGEGVGERARKEKLQVHRTRRWRTASMRDEITNPFAEEVALRSAWFFCSRLGRRVEIVDLDIVSFCLVRTWF